jgi:ABC-type uncharacterized transport system ATPase subunit
MIGVAVASVRIRPRDVPSDRLMVLFEGKIVAECDPTEFTKTELGLLMTGHSVETVRGMAS